MLWKCLVILAVFIWFLSRMCFKIHFKFIILQKKTFYIGYIDMASLQCVFCGILYWSLLLRTVSNYLIWITYILHYKHDIPITHHCVPFKKHCVIPRIFYTRANRSYCHSFLIKRCMFVIFLLHNEEKYSIRILHMCSFIYWHTAKITM